MNSLENFIRENKDQLDNKEVPEYIHEDVLKGVRKKDGLAFSWWAAAAVFFFCTTSALMVERYTSEKQALVSKLDFEETENFYAGKISERLGWLEGDKEGESVSPGTEYERMQAMYEILRKEWDQEPTDNLRDALILNLVVRLDILEKKFADRSVVPAVQQNKAADL
ncbi:MAG: hypothetical protein FJZ78_07255 [Bacteroidetes bacterium]|nr:hypothetical protein [Bacteroidota bacterium]